MNMLYTGQFYGQTNETIKLGGLTLSDTEYTHEKVDWHYHENAYFTFILNGSVLEGNKKEVYHCIAGSLLYHHWQEAHYNIKPKGFTRGFHVELVTEWFKRHGLNMRALQGSVNLQHPKLKLLMYCVFKEIKLDNNNSHLGVDSLLAELFSRAISDKCHSETQKPLWVTQIKNLMHDAPADNWTLHELANELNLHPVHLSRAFSKYFNCGLGEYQRMLKVQLAMTLLHDANLSLTTVALQSGFADQSHFIRSFKAIQNITPLAYQRLLS